MTIRDYQDDDYIMISGWLAMRDKAPIPKWALPETGVMVPGVACGFLVATNNKCGFLDFFVSNPLADRNERKEAFDEIMDELFICAKEAGIKMIFASSNLKSTKELALRHGLSSDGEFTCFKKEL